MGLMARPGRDFLQPTQVHLQRPEEPYPDPSNPDLKFWWKTGIGRYVKTKKFKNGIFVEMNLEDEDLLDAYANPVKYGFQNLPEVSEGKWLKKFDAKPYYCVSGWIEEWFHLVTYEEERRGEKVTWHERERCGGRECENCDEDWPKVFGNRFWMDFSFSQFFGPLDAVQELLTRLPKDGGYVWATHYMCNPEPEYDEDGEAVEDSGGCGEILVFDWGKGRDRKEVSLDMTNNCQKCGGSNISINAQEHMAECEDCTGVKWCLLAHEDPKLDRYLSSQLKCKGCGHEAYPVPVMRHTPDDDGDEVTEWDCWDIYDGSLVIQMVVEGKKKRLQVKVYEETDEEGNDLPYERKPDERLFEAEYQGTGEAAEKMAEKHGQCLDLERVHNPLSADDQAELIELPNLFDPHREARNQTRRVRYKPRGESDDKDGSEE